MFQRAAAALTALLILFAPGFIRAESEKKARTSFKGCVKAGQVFSRVFGPGFVFVLDPMYSDDTAVGWGIVILRGPEGHENLAGMTPPWRGPSVLDIVDFFALSGKHGPLRNTGFAFSPEVGQTITWDMLDQPGDSDLARTRALLDRIKQFGKGSVSILKYEMGVPDAKGSVPIAWLEFRADLSWPETYKPQLTPPN